MDSRVSMHGSGDVRLVQADSGSVNRLGLVSVGPVSHIVAGSGGVSARSGLVQEGPICIVVGVGGSSIVVVGYLVGSSIPPGSSCVGLFVWSIWFSCRLSFDGWSFVYSTWFGSFTCRFSTV